MTLEIQTASGIEAEASRRAAWRCLIAWGERVPAYAENRHLALDGHPWSSELSRFLTARLLLEEEVVGHLLENFAPPTIRRFVDSLCWRTYSKGWLEMHPSVWREWVAAVATLPGTLGPGEQIRLERAQAGETGIACFDDWARELQTTGYLHHQARRWFASIWTFTLGLPWELGAAFFFRHLLGADPAANTLSWRWVAGLQLRAQPFLVRAETIRRFTGGRYDPRGELVEKAPAIRVADPVPTQPLVACEVADGLRRPDLSESPAGLLLTGEDLCPEIGEFADAPFQSIAVLAPRDVFGPSGWSERVQAFKVAALRDAAERAAAHWGGTVYAWINPAELDLPVLGGADLVSAPAPMRVYSGVVDSWIPAVLGWARRERLRAVRLFEPPVGPWRDAVEVLDPALRRHGIALKRYRRAWDQLHWPHARAGHFTFRRGLEQRLGDYFAP